MVSIGYPILSASVFQSRPGFDGRRRTSIFRWASKLKSFTNFSSIIQQRMFQKPKEDSSFLVNLASAGWWRAWEWSSTLGRPSTKPGWTRIGSLGSDPTAARIGLRIGSDRTGIFASGAEELFWEKLLLVVTQVARNKKSKFSKQLRI